MHDDWDRRVLDWDSAARVKMMALCEVFAMSRQRQGFPHRHDRRILGNLVPSGRARSQKAVANVLAMSLAVTPLRMRISDHDDRPI